jgi:hypothetical protein
MCACPQAETGCVWTALAAGVGGAGRWLGPWSRVRGSFVHFLALEGAGEQHHEEVAQYQCTRQRAAFKVNSNPSTLRARASPR